MMTLILLYTIKFSSNVNAIQEKDMKQNVQLCFVKEN